MSGGSGGETIPTTRIVWAWVGGGGAAGASAAHGEIHRRAGGGGGSPCHHQHQQQQQQQRQPEQHHQHTSFVVEESQLQAQFERLQTATIMRTAWPAPDADGPMRHRCVRFIVMVFTKNTPRRRLAHGGADDRGPHPLPHCSNHPRRQRACTLSSAINLYEGGARSIHSGSECVRRIGPPIAGEAAVGMAAAAPVLVTNPFPGRKCHYRPTSVRLLRPGLLRSRESSFATRDRVLVLWQRYQTMSRNRRARRGRALTI
jgi:hypothetical protein